MSIYIERAEVVEDDLPMVVFKDNLSGSTLTASTTATGYDVANLKTGSTYDTWQPTSITSEIVVDMGSATAADTIAISAHNLGTAGTTVAFQTSPDNITYTAIVDEAASAISISPTDDSTLVVLITEQTKRYWKVLFTSAIPTVGVIQISQRLTFPNGIVPSYTPLWQSQNVELLDSSSMTGQFLGNRVVRRGGSGQVNIVPFEHTTLVDTDVQLFKTHFDNGLPLTFASYPSAFDQDAVYCWRGTGSELRPTFQDDGTYISITLSVDVFIQ